MDSRTRFEYLRFSSHFRGGVCVALMEMEEIGLAPAPEAPEDPAPGSDPKVPKHKHHNLKDGRSGINIRYLLQISPQMRNLVF